MTSDHLSPARPITLTRPWRHVSKFDIEGAETHAWQCRAMRVLSSAEMVEYRGVVCAHNHVSVSVGEDRRPTDHEMEMVRHDFDMHDAEEDNHQPGRIRNLFLPLHLQRGSVGVCDCKEDEEQVVESDGFVWSRPRASP